MKIATYETDLTDAQWALLERMIPKPNKRGRQRGDGQLFMNAILYLIKGGIPWRLLPSNFPPWQTVYHVFRKGCSSRRPASGTGSGQRAAGSSSGLFGVVAVDLGGWRIHRAGLRRLGEGTPT